MYKIDLHTHSANSPDGGITASQYTSALDNNLLNVIAITDHNSIDFGVAMHKQLGDKIIVGEEIMTSAGEIIGLYLTECIASGLSAMETVKQIKDQGGLVYIPHPFESVRKGVHPSTLEELVDYVDIMEICNGRAFLQNRSAQAVIWSKFNHITGVASSDAHGVRGLGKTYTSVPAVPNKENILNLLAHGTPITDRPGVRALLYPRYNVLRKKIKRAAKR